MKIINHFLEKKKREDYSAYKKSQIIKIGNFYLDSHSGTEFKFKLINNIIKKYNINAQVEIY